VEVTGRTGIGLGSMDGQEWTRVNGWKGTGLGSMDGQELD